MGPSFPNLFKENWDTFCKVGAIEAMDSPVAYLASLYRFATQQLEGSPADNKRITLDARRPDLKDLVIDPHTTFTPVPMLDIVKTVLEKGIREYVDTVGHPDNGKTVYELVARKRHPFLFPYNYQHQQVMLGLSGKKPALGELYYRISQALPISGVASNEYGAPSVANGIAQCWLSGLSPEQQNLLIEKTIFSTYYITRSELLKSSDKAWKAAGSLSLIPFHDTEVGYFFRAEPESCLSSGATVLEKTNTTLGWSTLQFNEKDTATQFSFRSSGYQLEGNKYFKIINPRTESNAEKSLRIYYVTADNNDTALPDLNDANPSSIILVAATPKAADGVDDSPRSLFEMNLTLSISNSEPDVYQLTPPQIEFFKASYGVTVPYVHINALTRASSFLEKTGLTAEQLEALLAQKNYTPTCSPNCLPLNQLFAGGTYIFPQALHYGAAYVNGVGGRDPGTINFDVNDNSIGLALLTDEQDVTDWRLTNASLNRFDRLQRMIRLQRWMGIPFAELDTLIMAAVHSEGENNLGWELNINTLRALGVYRYLSKRYTLTAEEFAAFMHHLTPFAVGTRKPLFDRVFNHPQLFDTPLVIDGAEFSIDAPDPTAQKTILQLCAGLGLQPAENSFGLLADDTTRFIGPAEAGTPVSRPLKRLLPVVSSLYRQARIAELFGLSVEDSRGLIHLLGADTYIKQVVTGRLTKHNGINENAIDAVPDILDILMQLDWLVSWLKETQWTATTVRTLLQADEGGIVSPVRSILSPIINNIQGEVVGFLLQPRDYDKLNLPILRVASVITRWFDLFEGTYDQYGLVDIESIEGASADLLECLTQSKIGLDGITGKNYPYLNQVIQKIVDLRYQHYCAQENYISDLLVTLNAPRHYIDLALQWAGVTRTELLYNALFEKEDFIEKIIVVHRNATLIQDLGISSEGLRTFVNNPHWLDTHFETLPTSLTLNALYLLNRYVPWVSKSAQPEDRLLDYLKLANQTAAEPEEHTQRCASELADLIGWTVSEVKQAFQVLPTPVATSMAHVDWVLRVHNTSVESGLAVASLQGALDLTMASTAAEWQAVSEAVMATVHQ
nr:Tc toxin subunit A [Pseudomonas sp.]